MSYIKKYVDSLDKVKMEYERDGHDKFVRTYIKYDSYLGPSDAIDFIINKLSIKLDR